MIALIIIAIVLFAVLTVLFLPARVSLSFEEDFFVKVKFAGIKLFDSDAKKKRKKYRPKHTESKPQKNKESTVAQDTKKLFSFLKKKYGFTGAVKLVLNLAKDMLTHIKKLLRHIKIDHVTLDATVCAEDAAQTAIAYGKVCSAAYPVLAYLNSCAKIGFKQININSDFSGNKPEFKFSARVSLQLIFLLIAAYRVYSEYKKFVLKENFNERE